MQTDFGFIPNTIHEISDWRQLLNITPTVENVAVAIVQIHDDICEGLSIKLLNKYTNEVYISFFVSGSAKSAVDIRDIITPPTMAEFILSRFGYNVVFTGSFDLSKDMKDFLHSLLKLGYQFIGKTNADDVVLLADFHGTKAELENAVPCNTIPAYCEISDSNFSFLRKGQVLPISRLV